MESAIVAALPPPRQSCAVSTPLFLLSNSYFLLSPSRSRMKLPVDCLQALLVHVRVNLRRRNIGVPEHFLDDPEIRAVAEEMGREAVPQQVRINIRLEPRLFRALLHDLPDPRRRQFRSAARQKDLAARS